MNLSPYEHCLLRLVNSCEFWCDARIWLKKFIHAFSVKGLRLRCGIIRGALQSRNVADSYQKRMFETCNLFSLRPNLHACINSVLGE